MKTAKKKIVIKRRLSSRSYHIVDTGGLQKKNRL